ncbi:MAG: DinB family protein [Acidobacteria bacterium]|nr:DinB family protein [Acidobacteriota bacterium]
MISPGVLRELYDYNFWARDQQLAVCEKLSEEQLSRPLGASFGSLLDTLKHLLGAEWVWMERFDGRDARSVPWYKETSSMGLLRVRWALVEADLRRFVESLTPQALTAPLTYVNFKGETWTYPLWQMLLHLANHGTYHRGQVTMALRQLGATPPAIDFLVYYDKK